MNLLFKDYYFSIIDEKEFLEIFLEKRKDVFEDSVGFQVHQLLSELEVNKLKALKTNLDNNFKLFLKVTKADNIVGWSFGQQSDNEPFTMMNTGILKEYRNQGVYTNLLQKFLDILKNKGFQKVESQHNASNNQVIIPKLKAGFIITGLEIDDKVGMRVKLNYHFNQDRQKIIDFRIGNKKLPKGFEKYLDLWE